MAITTDEVKQIAHAIAVSNGSPSPGEWAETVAANYQAPPASQIELAPAPAAVPEPVPTENISGPEEVNLEQPAV